MHGRSGSAIGGVACAFIAIWPPVFGLRWKISRAVLFYGIATFKERTFTSNWSRLLNSPAPPSVRTMPAIEVSWGELVDKITILEIKQKRLASPAAVANVQKELAALTRAFAQLDPAPPALDGLKRELKVINEALWDIENRTRAKEAAKTFDQEFIGLTRSVYLNNDKRAGIKRRINELLNSGLIEEKQYTAY
jgi:hypothetical protein